MLEYLICEANMFSVEYHELSLTDLLSKPDFMVENGVVLQATVGKN